MKLFAALLTAAAILAPGLANAAYVCNKRFAEIHGQNCPAGSVWDASYHACIIKGS